jgi:hypothetical protein
MVYVFYRNAQSKSHSDPHDIYTLSLLYQFPNSNLFTQHVLFILWRDATSELWIPVQFPFTLLYHFTFTRTVYFVAYYYPITTQYAQSFVYSKLVRLTTSLSSW